MPLGAVEEENNLNIPDAEPSFATFIPVVSNRKLAPVDPKTLKPKGPFVASTYASIEVTCPSYCVFKGNGCYAEGGFVGLKNAAFATKGHTYDAALEETTHILKFIGTAKVPQDGGRDGKHGRDLRLHVSGDATTWDAAKLLAHAAKEWRKSGGGSVWTYTHAWRWVDRRAWGDISVLASCETPDDIHNARNAGYATALTVRSHRGATKAYSSPWPMLEGKIIPCPAETKPGVTCVSCRLCFDDKKLRAMKATIAFEVHGDGPTQKKAKRMLPIIDSLFGVLR